MKIGGLSEKEVQEISKILSDASVSFNVATDQHIQDFNDKSIRNDLRHLSAPSISTNILSIEIDESVFETLSQGTLKKLYRYGITDLIPEGLEVDDPNPLEPIQNQILSGQRKVIGTYFALAVGMTIVYFVIDYIRS